MEASECLRNDKTSSSNSQSGRSGDCAAVRAIEQGCELRLIGSSSAGVHHAKERGNGDTWIRDKAS